MQTQQFVLYLVMIYGTSFFFIYLADSVYEHLPFARTNYRNLMGGFMMGLVIPMMPWVIQGVHHPNMQPSLPDGRYVLIMIATVYYGVITKWARFHPQRRQGRGRRDKEPKDDRVRNQRIWVGGPD
jgi:hypothetical protein